MRIRNMTIGDYDKVYQLWAETPGLGLNSLDDSRQGIEKYLARNPATCFVAEKDGRVIGAILAGHDGRRGYIGHTAVALAERRQGLGRALVEAAMTALEKEGLTKVVLVVFAANESGNGFWEKNGFTVRNDLIYRNKAIRNSIRFDT